MFIFYFFFFFNDPATPEIYTLSLHDALPIYISEQAAQAESGSSAVPPISQAVPREIGSWPGGPISADEAARRALIMFLSGSGDVCPTSRAG